MIRRELLRKSRLFPYLHPNGEIGLVMPVAHGDAYCVGYAARQSRLRQSDFVDAFGSANVVTVRAPRMLTVHTPAD
jgi:hypothetical protein